MKKLLTLVLLMLPLALLAQERTEKLKVYIFTSPTCGHCMKMKKEFIPGFKDRVKNMVEVIEIDTSKENILFQETADAYGQQYYVPAMAVGETYLLGYPTEVGTGALAAIEKALKNNEVTKVKEASKTHSENFSNITFAAIVMNGLIDGINPCAFAVIVFFVSFLAVYGYTKKEVIYIGTAYCLAVFTAYFLIGFGVFNFLYAMRGFQMAIHIFYWLTVVACFILFGFAIYDLVYYLRTKKTDAMLLQLPKSFKLMTNKITGFFLRDKGERGVISLGLAAFAVGILVSLIEAVCTGQVYIPTIVLIMKEEHFRVRAISYLVLYNLLFILPLIAVFLLSLLGYTSNTFNAFLKKHMALTKGLFALVFLALAILLLQSTF